MNRRRLDSSIRGLCARGSTLLDRAGAARVGASIEGNATSIAVVALSVALLVRVAASIPRVMNPDEAMNFLDANSDTLFGSGLQGMQISAHPPLAFILTWLASRIDLSEWVLRLPSAISGVAAAALAYRLLRASHGVGAGLIGLVLFGFAPPMLELGAQTRGYTLEILLLVASLHLFWSGEQRRSACLLAVSGLTTALAIATEYSAMIAAVPLGVLGLWGWLRSDWRRDMSLAWMAGQCVVVSTVGLLWLARISTLHGGGMAETARTGWLAREYFDPSGGSGLHFLATRSVELFVYLFRSEWIGWLALAVVVLGMVRPRWLENRAPEAESHEVEPSVVSLRLLLWVGFAVAAGVALAGLYPYGGTRHSVYLGVFVYLACAAFLAEVARRNLAVLAVCLLVFSVSQGIDVVSDGWDPDDAGERIVEASTGLAEAASADPWIFLDKQNANQLRFYRCPNAADQPAPDGYETFQCKGLRLGQSRAWRLEAADFDRALSNFVDAYQLAPGTPIYAVSLNGWGESLVLSLQARGYPLSSLHRFGDKVAFAQVRGAQVRGVQVHGPARVDASD